MEEKRQSCDLTEYIMNALESKLAEGTDMETREHNGDATSIDMDEIKVDDDKVFDSNHIQDEGIVTNAHLCHSTKPISECSKNTVIKRCQDLITKDTKDDNDNLHKAMDNSHKDQHVAFSFEGLSTEKKPKNSVPLAWNLLSKKRKSRAKKRKKSAWTIVRDNLKAVNFMRALTKGDVDGIKQVLKQNPSLTTYTDDTGISALEKAVNSRSSELLKAFIDNTADISKGDLLESAILYAIKMDCVDTVSFLLEEREMFWKRYEDCNTPKSATPKSTSPKWYKTGSAPFKQFLNFKMKERDATDPNQKQLREEGIDILSSAVNRSKEKEDPQPPIKLASFENSEFCSYTTPIILAAKLERLDIIKLIIERDASEIHPMTMPCPYENIMDCDICSEKMLFKRSRNLEDSNHMIEIYRALSSPAYILLSGVSDPVLEAFVLSRELEHMQEEDPPFKFEYGALSKKCRLFAEELLGLCRTTEEVETMLRREEGVKDFDRCGARTGLSRVIVALNFKQKEFIAHPYCQQVLQKSWYTGLPQWVHESEYHYTTLLFYYLFWLLVWPIACIIFMLKIWPRVIIVMKCPITKYITDTFSYLTFLLCLIVNSVYYDRYHSEQKAGDFFNPIEILMILWIIGLTARQFKMFWRHRTAWQRLDFVSLNRDIRWTDIIISFSFTFWAILRLAGFIYGYTSGSEEQIRIEWYSTHPILVAEAFYCAGTVVAFLKISSLFTTSSTLGPMHISLKKMVNDIVRFLAIFIIIMIGFIVAIKTLYSNYANNIIVDSSSGASIQQNQEYVGFKNTINTLFWHIFGYGDVQFANIVVNRTYERSEDHHDNHVLLSQNNLTLDNSTSVSNFTGAVMNKTGRVFAKMVLNHHSFTEGVGYTLVGTYHIFILIVLLNMLIAMMNNSYQAIVEDSDKEWKFARTRLRMTYYNEVGSLPPPFNVWILGTIMKQVIRVLGKCIGVCRTLDEQTKESLRESVHRENECEYKELIVKINKRYWNKQTTKRNKEIVIAPESLENLLRSNRISTLYGAESCA